ncbi:MAG: ABC transporter [Actinobacteria bacterium HGW-Actinobacteria-4]|nr:MAG: ABC transporter [Actinobacteria bacterium HGW-Actinobacteria-4]
MSSAYLSFSHLHFSWPDGTAVLADAGGALSAGLTAVVGANGAGKSTLLRLLSGELAPARGIVTCSGALRYVPQDVTLNSTAWADDILGIAHIRAALRAIEAGSTDPAHYDLADGSWDIEERATATLSQVGLPPDTLDRQVGELSGGETMKLSLASALLDQPDVLLLDEPTNNLDTQASARLIRALSSRKGATLVVSHDRALLREADAVGELRAGRLRWFGGNIDDYEAALAVEQAAVLQAVRTAEATVAREHRELRSHVEGAGKRKRVGDKAARNGMPKMVVNAKKNQAQATLARVTGIHEERLAAARERLEAAESAVIETPAIRVDLPESAVPPRRDVATVASAVLRNGPVATLAVKGPERIAVIGANGAGKTTLIETLVGAVPASGGTVEVHVPVGYLPQRLDVLDNALTVVDNVRMRAPGASPHEVRAALARFLFRGRDGDALAATLSGGERFRASLACVLLARPSPQLLLLDEPTNNLDFASRDQLVSALAEYRGALLVASHDTEFLAAIGITRWIEVTGSEVAPPVTRAE